MKTQDKEEEYKHNVWEIYRKEWATANREKQIILNKRVRRWQELMKNGWTASRAYYRVMEEESGKSPGYSFWSWMRKASFVILGLALAAAIVYCVVITGEINTLKAELDSAQSELASTQSELNSTKQILASTRSDLASTQTDLASTQTELDSIQVKLASTQADLASTQADLDSTQAELSSTKQTLASTQQQLAVAQETLGGLGITLYASKECSDVVLIDNPAATNPTWSQLMAFLSQDQTETHEYILDEYDCSQFSRDVHNNAEARGIRAAEVHVQFRNEEWGHALNAFLTTDYGLVYVDCTGAPDRIAPDKIARAKAGKEYRAVELYKITRSNIRNDFWWDNLHLSSYITFVSTGRHNITSDIKIYW